MTENNGRSFYDDDIDDEPLEETGAFAFIRKYWVALGIGTVVVGSLIFTGLGGGVSVPAENPNAVATGNSTPANSLPSTTAKATPSAIPSPTETFVPKYLVSNGPDQAPTVSDWKPTAKTFAAAWANPAEGRDAWLASLRPHVDDSLYIDLESVDVNLVPIDTVLDVSALKEDQMGVAFNVSFVNPNLKMTAYMQWDPAQSKWVVYQISR